MANNTSRYILAACLAATVGAHVHSQAPNPRQQSGRAMDCVNLTKLTFDGNTSITSATPVSDRKSVV